MFHVACLNLPQLPLQIALRLNPGWEGQPAAVTADSRPTSKILHINAQARERGASVGSRYLDALGLVPDLRATEVREEDLASASETILAELRNFSPEIEPVGIDRESIWLNARGMVPLFPSNQAWLSAMQTALRKLGFHSRVALGFSRLGSYLAVKSSRSHMLILDSPAEEERQFSTAALDHLPLSDNTRRQLRRLGIRRVADLLGLPVDGAQRRFGEEIRYLRSLLETGKPLPVQAIDFVEEAGYSRRFDAALFSADRILEEARPLVETMLAEAAKKELQVSDLTLSFHYENGTSAEELVRFAVPTTLQRTVMKLVGLRLDSIKLADRVEKITLRPGLVRMRSEQTDLFGLSDGDAEAIGRAFAVIRARLGNGAIVSARLLDSHLPTASFEWQPLAEFPRVGAPVDGGAPDWSGDDAQPRPIFRIRRLFESDKAGRLKPHPSRLLGRVHKLSSLWWVGEAGEYRRSYCYCLNAEGQILWLVRDGEQRTWQVQGSLD